MKRAILALVVLFQVLVAPECYAWWAAPGGGRVNSTHWKLGASALDLVKAIQVSDDKCPDIERFGMWSVDWTGLEKFGIVPWMSGGTDDPNAHGKRYEDEFNVTAGEYNGGPIKVWWGTETKHLNYPNDGVLKQYKAFNIADGDYSAYYYMAMMGHLVADQAAPVHAANIRHDSPAYLWPLHPLTYGDNLERDAYYSDLAGSYAIKSLGDGLLPEQYYRADAQKYFIA